jgi:hypothetical protein
VLVDTIYRGATELQMWPEIVASATERLESPKGMLYTPSPKVEECRRA